MKNAAKERRDELLRKERELGLLRWYYLSFADDVQFRGGVIIEAYGPATAISKAWELGINPGGEVLFTEIPPSHCPPPEASRNRLLTRKQLEEFFGPTERLGDRNEQVN